MKLMFIPAQYKLDFSLPENSFEVLKKKFKKNSNLAVYSAVNFHNEFDYVLDEIKKNGFNPITSKPDRCLKLGQILGCASYKKSLHLDISKIDGFVYIGDGYFHPNALLLAQENEDKIKPVVILNVVAKEVEVLGDNHIRKYLTKRKSNLMNFHMSKVIGVFITTKWGQEYLDTSTKLKEKYKDKKFYFFIGDNFLDNEIENFPYCEVFINTACPRIGQDDVLRHSKPVVNLSDVL